jgi:hypothetical protein
MHRSNQTWWSPAKSQRAERKTCNALKLLTTRPSGRPQLLEAIARRRRIRAKGSGRGGKGT